MTARQFVETPAFPEIGTVSISFAWEIRFGAKVDAFAGRPAFRLAKLEQQIPEQAYAALVQPLGSFLDDITSGPPGRYGRPLILAGSPEASDDAARMVWAIRPGRWTYEFEGETTELLVGDGSPRTIAFRLQDSICVFGDGRIYFVLTLVVPPKSRQPIDEYAIIQLQQFALEPALLDRPEFLAFSSAGSEAGSQSLLDLAEARLAALEAPDAPRPNAIADVIKPLLARRETRAALAVSDFRNLCIAIDDPRVLAAARRAFALSEPDDAEIAGPGVVSGPGIPPPHRQDRNPIDPALLALTGLTQAVPDFPFQDFSELYESTRPTTTSMDSSSYAHPRFFLEVATDWRALGVGQRTVGTCPYLLLLWMTSIHAEQLVEEMESLIESIRYDSDQQSLSTVPLAQVDRLIQKSRSVMSLNRVKLLESGLKRRVQLLRIRDVRSWEKMFRYPKEKVGFHAVQAALGTLSRFDDAELQLDELEEILKEISALHYSHSERRTNSLLLVIALLSVLSVSSDVNGELRGGAFNPGFGGIAAALALFLLVVLLVGQMRLPRS